MAVTQMCGRSDRRQAGDRGQSPPKYQPVLAAGYDEEALLQQQCRRPKKSRKPSTPSYAMELMGMVVEHIASLSPPPPLLAYARPLARYEGQMMSPPPDARVSDNDRIIRTGR
jgi:hypothetical protein